MNMYMRSAGPAGEACTRAAGVRRGVMCDGGAVFATLVSGVGYVKGVTCLIKQFQLLGSQCPLLIVYDDLDSSQRIPNATLADWALELGGERWLVNIASLARRFYGHDRHPFASTTMNSLATKGHAWTMRTHRKLFLWALSMRTTFGNCSRHGCTIPGSSRPKSCPCGVRAGRSRGN